MPDPSCKFCLANELLVDEPLAQSSHFFVLGSIEQDRPAQAIIVPFRHVAAPFDLTPAEWADLGEALTRAKSLLEPFRPAGWTIGWNTGAVAGQEIFHAHLHVIVRFQDEPTAGRGIHALFRTS